MYPAPHGIPHWFAEATLLQAQQVYAAGSGQRGQCRVGAGKRCGHQSDAERHDDPHAQCARSNHCGQQGVAPLGHSDALRPAHGVQQDAQCQEKQVDGHEAQTIGAHVLLRLAQRAAGQVLLHHVLVQSRHDDDDEYAAQELPPECLWRSAVPFKNPAHRRLAHGLDHTAEAQAQHIGGHP